MMGTDKLPLDPIFAMGDGCSAPLSYYYECHTAGALESVLTRDDSCTDGEHRDDESNDAESRDLPPLLKAKAKRPLTFLDKINQSVSTPSAMENGLLATAKGEGASSCVIGMLEAHKRQNFDNQSTTSNSSKKEKKDHQRFAVTVPLYASMKVGTAVDDGKRDQKYSYSYAPPSTSTPDHPSAIEAIKIAAAAKWRAAKKRHFAPTSASETPAEIAETAAETMTATVSVSASPSTPKSPTPSTDAAAPEQPRPNKPEDGGCAQSDRADTENIDADAISVDRSQSRRQAVDPPEDVLKLPTACDERKSLIVDASLLNHQRLREEELGGAESILSTTDSVPLFRKLSEDLRQMEDQQEAHRFRLFEQRLRHQKWKTHLKERVAGSSVGLRPSATVGEEYKVTSTEKSKDGTAVVKDPVVPSVFLIPVEPCQ